MKIITNKTEEKLSDNIVKLNSILVTKIDDLVAFADAVQILADIAGDCLSMKGLTATFNKIIKEGEEK